ncbi:hypothetical protein DFP73DRAFT_6952 [Morchella snyderi]|nr:hypothetical protein DFP73DRAFT_6952 [Morchella snyderi]
MAATITTTYTTTITTTTETQTQTEKKRKMRNSSKSIPMHPSRVFYFSDGDTIISCRDRSYRVHSHLLSQYSAVMQKALSKGRLSTLWKYLGTVKKGCEPNQKSKSKPVQDILYLVSLDDRVKTVELLFYCVYSCGNLPRLTPRNLPTFLRLSTAYTIPSLLAHCKSYLHTLSLFHPLQALTTPTTPATRSLHSEALTTILHDLPRYKSNPEYERLLPSAVRHVFTNCWGAYVERVEALRSGESLFGKLAYPHSSKCEDTVGCEAETRHGLLKGWNAMWERCKGEVPRPSEISRFFMTTEQKGPCGAQVMDLLKGMLEDMGGADAAWDLRVGEAVYGMGEEVKEEDEDEEMS